MQNVAGLLPSELRYHIAFATIHSLLNRAGGGKGTTLKESCKRRQNNRERHDPVKAGNRHNVPMQYQLPKGLTLALVASALITLSWPSRA